MYMYTLLLQGEYRNDLLQLWRDNLTLNKVPRGDSCSLVGTLGDPVKIRSWQISGSYTIVEVYFLYKAIAIYLFMTKLIHIVIFIHDKIHSYSLPFYHKY